MIKMEEHTHHANPQHAQHANPQHGHDEVVLGKNCDEWTKEWCKHLSVIGAEESPLFYNNGNSNPYKNLTKNVFRDHRKDNTREGVYFLSSRYTDPENYDYQYHIIPRGDFHLFALYGYYYCPEVYRSKKSEDLYELAQHQLDSTYKLEAKLDGRGIEFCRVSLEEPFEIRNIPEDNIFGLSADELRNCDYRLNMVGCFNVLFLKPLSVGNHLLDITGYSPFYGMNVGFQFDVLGP